MGGELIKRHDGSLEEGTKIGDIGFVERQGVLGQHHIAIDRIGTGSDTSAIAEEADLFLFLGAVRLHLVATLLDPQAAVRVAFGDVGHIEAAFDVDVGIVFAHPGPRYA